VNNLVEVRLHPQLYAALSELAAAEDCTLEFLVIALINAALDQRLHTRS
jgi:hypothetical protein